MAARTGNQNSRRGNNNRPASGGQRRNANLPAARTGNVPAPGQRRTAPPDARRKQVPSGAAQSKAAPGRQLFVKNAAKPVGEPIKDYSMIFIVLFLLVFGLIMLYSTSSYEAAIKFGDGAYYLKRQAISTVVGIAGFIAASLFPLSLIKKYAWVAYAFSAVLVILVIPLGREANGAKRWIYFGPVSVQPAEISKIAVIIVTALLIEQLGERINTIKGMITAFMPAAIQAVMIYVITRNLSSAIIIAAIAAGMLFVASGVYGIFAVLAGGVAAIVFGVIQYAQRSMESPGGLGDSFRLRRIVVWLDPQRYADSGGYQTLQALYGIGSGGIIGKGLGQSMQKLGYIPEAQNDMIFSIICEELGMFGAISIIIMFLILCWRFMVVATNASDLYSALLVVGVMTHIAVQVVLNIAVVTNTIPNTGVTLPFFSYGGTSVLFLLTEVGLVRNVARGIRLRDL